MNIMFLKRIRIKKNICFLFFFGGSWGWGAEGGGGDG